MKHRNFRAWCIPALALLCSFPPLTAQADVNVDVSIGGPGYTVGLADNVTVAPPPLPIYAQPPCPQADFQWLPGYWAWGQYGYYWVPGTWIAAPQPGLVWTPGYWGWNSGYYAWHRGYWGPYVGYYGGVNYGYGYIGSGFIGGAWSSGYFHYNTAFVNVGFGFGPRIYSDPTGFNNVYVANNFVNRNQVNYVRNVYVRNVYVRNVYVRNVHVNKTTNVYNNTTNVYNHTTNVSYAGGPGGVQAAPSRYEIEAAQRRRFSATPVQRAHESEARANSRYLASVNHGMPEEAAVARPLTRAERPATFVPLRSAGRRSAPVRRMPTDEAQSASFEHPHAMRRETESWDREPSMRREARPPRHEHVVRREPEFSEQRPVMRYEPKPIYRESEHRRAPAAARDEPRMPHESQHREMP